MVGRERPSGALDVSGVGPYRKNLPPGPRNPPQRIAHPTTTDQQADDEETVHGYVNRLTNIVGQATAGATAFFQGLVSPGQERARPDESPVREGRGERDYHQRHTTEAALDSQTDRLVRRNTSLLVTPRTPLTPIQLPSRQSTRTPGAMEFPTAPPDPQAVQPSNTTRQRIPSASAPAVGTGESQPPHFTYNFYYMNGSHNPPVASSADASMILPRRGTSMIAMSPARAPSAIRHSGVLPQSPMHSAAPEWRPVVSVGGRSQLNVSLRGTSRKRRKDEDDEERGTPGQVERTPRAPRLERVSKAPVTEIGEEKEKRSALPVTKQSPFVETTTKIPVGIPAEKKPESTGAAPSPFSYGAQSTTAATEKKEEPKSSAFGLGGEKREEPKSSAFGLGGEKKEAPTAPPSFSLGAKVPAPPAATPPPSSAFGSFKKEGAESVMIEDDGFASNAGSDDEAEEKKPASAPANAFNFSGTGSSSANAAKSSTSFAFGATSDKSSAPPSASASFSFGDTNGSRLSLTQSKGPIVEEAHTSSIPSSPLVAEDVKVSSTSSASTSAPPTQPPSTFGGKAPPSAFGVPTSTTPAGSSNPFAAAAASTSTTFGPAPGSGPSTFAAGASPFTSGNAGSGTAASPFGGGIPAPGGAAPAGARRGGGAKARVKKY